ncbi:hypothetical protein JCM19037_261 [Geomicrobium sp. JCM 19037]|nr:hypothetical protein JCM19037_261 [Geomicrobium sp. JCM 19037]
MNEKIEQMKAQTITLDVQNKEAKRLLYRFGHCRSITNRNVAIFHIAHKLCTALQQFVR